jgi:hypothetical protein
MKRKDKINLLEIELNALTAGMIILPEEERRMFEPEFNIKRRHYEKIAGKKYIPRGGYDTVP